MARTDRSYSFSNVPTSSRPRSSLDRTHRHITTIDAGKLYPLRVAEVYPGDTINCKPTVFGRILTLLDPIMDDVEITLHAFLVPYRILYDKWEHMNGERDDVDDTTEYVLPKMTVPSGGFPEDSLADYMRLPTKVQFSTPKHSLPFRAYRKCYNDWYRDNNLQDAVPLDTGTGPDPEAYGVEIFRRGKRHDYFTACLPFQQRGPDVPLALAGSAPVVGVLPIAGTPSTPPTFRPFGTGFPPESFGAMQTTTVGANDALSLLGTRFNYSGPVEWGTTALTADFDAAGGSIYADLSNAVGANINALRESVALQHLLEADARGGGRYVEQLKAIWGVTSPDFRLQRAELIGTHRSKLNVSTVVQNSQSTTDSALGDLSAMGVFSGGGRGFVKTATEHSIFIVIGSVRAGLMYQQGVDKWWNRSSRWDHYHPQFANLGEQPVYREEIFASGVEAEDTTVFGYQEAWAELRHERSSVSGRMRSNATQPLHTWHLAQQFANAPVLGDEFIQDDPPFDRVVAVQNEPIFKLDCLFEEKWARQLPLFSVPGLRRL